MSPRLHVRVLLVTIAATLMIGATAACSGSDDATSTPDATAAGTTEPTAESATVEATTTEPAATETTTATSDDGSGETAETVSANDATIDELTAAFEAADIPNASRWAREVDEYRPYSEDDTDYAKLRGELAKYNPSPETLEAIIATLHLP